jgi:protein-disulfide isomerase
VAFAILRPIFLLFCFAAAMALPALAAAQQSRDPDTVRIERIVRNYLLQNPELLVEVMQKLEQRQKAKQNQDLIGAIKANRKALFASAGDYIVNPMGRIPVVEFFDYQCGYCKKFHPTLARLMKTDKSVRVVFKEFPILGEVSVVASRAALAAKKQGKYLEFHNALLSLRRRLTETLIFQVAKDLGLDVARMKKDMNGAEILAVIQTNRDLATELGIRGTPSIVVGQQMAPGAVSYERLIAMIDHARTNCAVC